MIQRIQTIFLLLAGGAFGAVLGLPFSSRPPETTGIYSDGNYTAFDGMALHILAITGVVLALVIIFLFKNRKLQRTLGFLLVAVALAILICAYLFLENHGESFTEAGTRLGPALFMPILSIILVLVANRYITKDEKLVKSMDRLR